MRMKGTSFGSTTEMEISLAKYIIKFIPSIEKIRFVNSGTEATHKRTFFGGAQIRFLNLCTLFQI